MPGPHSPPTWPGTPGGGRWPPAGSPSPRRGGAALRLSLPGGHDQGGALVLEPMASLRRLTGHIPDAGRHQVRYSGVHANRSRALYRAADEGISPTPVVGKEAESRLKCRARQTRLIRRAFPCDPLTCLRCGARMRIVAFLTEGRVIDETLRHLEAHLPKDLFLARDTPAV